MIAHIEAQSDADMLTGVARVMRADIARQERERLGLRVLIGCEYSAVVRDAFRARGFNAWSCDLLPTEGDPRWHIQGDVLLTAYSGRWDMALFHPPCTHLAVSGARHFAAKRADGRQQAALDFVRCLLNAPIRHIALENPVSIISSAIRKPDCTYQPWQHGHGEVKRSCLWLKNLPALKPSNEAEGRDARVHRMPPGPDRWKERSRTLPGVAAAMAEQFGDHIQQNPPRSQPHADGLSGAGRVLSHGSEIAGA